MQKKVKRTFFLLEVLVAMALFALAILPLLTMEWGIFNAEREEKRRFERELAFKHDVIETLVLLYQGKFTHKALEEGIKLKTLPGTLSFDEEKEDILNFRYLLPKGGTRDFSLPAYPKG